jgi:hypothetical protein
MALDNTKKTTSFIPKGVNKSALEMIRKVAEKNGVTPRNNAELVTWWINEMTPTILATTSTLALKL